MNQEDTCYYVTSWSYSDDSTSQGFHLIVIAKINIFPPLLRLLLLLLPLSLLSSSLSSIGCSLYFLDLRIVNVFVLGVFVEES